MKSKLILIIACLSFVSCATLGQLDQSTKNATAYIAGKGVGAGINEFAPQLDTDLGKAWTDLIDRNKTVDIVPASEILQFYNSVILILSSHVDDPYGLIGDLAVLFTIYGGQFNEDGKLISIQPIELITLKYFELGYNSGKGAVLRSVLKFPDLAYH